MTLRRWAIAFGQLGLLLAVIGAGPALVMMVVAPSSNALLPVLLSLTVAPLGALCLLTAAIMWLVGRIRN
ncbi:hypothetical protein [Pelagibacterium lentulum]|uniref:Uncharacterized protein n=1 Tax=Pelagibacterium lentulum TaxID=2029865 RepID=A0A916RAE9_9HYPH|nr:hypothetical protein [Pelagibacterium lentulum]GGA45282.1 hypothetical protein GCM10011499_13730 [Pelagibacterium lentulum]